MMCVCVMQIVTQQARHCTLDNSGATLLVGSPNRTRKSGARFFSTTGMTYGDTAVLSALMRLAMVLGRQSGINRSSGCCGVYVDRRSGYARIILNFLAAIQWASLFVLFSTWDAKHSGCAKNLGRCRADDRRWHKPGTADDGRRHQLAD